AQRLAIDLAEVPGATAVAPIEEVGEPLQVAAIGLDGVGRLVATLLQVEQEVAHQRRSQSVASHAAKSCRARSTCRSLRTALGIFPVSGSSRPKLAFMGWKCSGSASAR